jgi:hypothetical protein
VTEPRGRSGLPAVLAVLAFVGVAVTAVLSSPPGGEAEPVAAAPALPVATPAAAGDETPPDVAPEQPDVAPKQPPVPEAPAPAEAKAAPAGPKVAWRRSRAVGLPWSGRLVAGVQLPAAGPTFVSWDPIQKRSPSRGWRRWGADHLVRVVLEVADAHAAAHPGAPRIVVGDLSRPKGGDFSARFGGVGHASHQNGLDVDVYYPRKDRLERPPTKPSQIDRRLAQDLVDRFVAAGATFVFVGPNTGLRGPRRVVQVLPQYHDNHMHVRLPPRG